MADTVNLTTSISAVGSVVTDALDVQTQRIVQSYITTYTDGATGSNKINGVHASVRTLAALSSEGLLLRTSPTTLQDLEGNDLSLKQLNVLIVAHATTTANDSFDIFGTMADTLAGGSSPNALFNVWPANGFVAWSRPFTSGWTVTATTGETLTIRNNDGNSADYFILVGGIRV